MRPALEQMQAYAPAARNLPTSPDRKDTDHFCGRGVTPLPNSEQIVSLFSTLPKTGLFQFDSFRSVPAKGDERQTRPPRAFDYQSMEVLTQARIVKAETLNDGLVIKFADGRCAFYSTSLLDTMFPQAQLMDENEDAW